MKCPTNQQKIDFWQNFEGPATVAHRGGDAAGIEKENSLKAFEAAYKLGYRWFETDVVPTKDGKLLATHGRGFQLKPNKDLPTRLKIQRTLYRDLKDLTIGGEPLLLLEELLNTFKDVKLFIDPKTYKSAPLLAELLISRPADLNRICVGSFHRFNTTLVCKRVKEATNEDIACAAIGAFRGLFIIFAAEFPFLGFLFKRYIRITRTNTAYLPYKLIIGKNGHKLIRLAHELDLKVATYTPNDEKSIALSLKSGVDAVMSDRIRLLKELKTTIR